MARLIRFLAVFLLSSVGFAACGGGGGGSSSGTAAVQAELVAGDLPFPVGIAAAPDDRIFFTELKTGRVRILQGGQLVPTPFATLDVPPEGTEGVLGIALDRDFSQNGFVYVFTAVSGPLRNRVVRYRAEGNLGADAAIVLDNLPNGGHNGGKMVSASDGTLFVSTGDTGNPATSQDLGTLAGKILRVNRDGSIPGDNPIAGSPIFALGFRNVFGLAIDPRDGKLFASENGPDCDDEIDLVTAGGNYGWRPEQPCGDTDPSFVQPLERFNPTLGITGIAFYSGAVIPGLANALLIGDVNTGSIRSYVFRTSDGAIESASVLFPGNPSGVLDITVGADGLPYFTTQNGIYRLVPQ